MPIYKGETSKGGTRGTFFLLFCNMYEKGLGKKWEARMAYWANPTPELRQQFSSAYALETIIGQYTFGTPEGSVGPDGYSLDYYYVNLPGPAQCRNPFRSQRSLRPRLSRCELEGGQTPEQSKQTGTERAARVKWIIIQLCRGATLSLHPSNGGRTYPLVHGNGHCDWVQADGTVHEPPHARRTIPATAARMQRSR